MNQASIPLLLAQAGKSPLDLIWILVAMFLVMWFLIIGPQRKQLKQHKELLASLKKGDEVVTQGGILGRIYSIDDKVVTVEVASSVRIRVLKSSVNGKVPSVEEKPAAAPAEKKEEK